MDTKKQNIIILHYQYKNAHNYKTRDFVNLANPDGISWGEVEKAFELHDSDLFVPGDFDIPAISPVTSQFQLPVNDYDHAFHEVLGADEGVGIPNCDITATELINNLQADKPQQQREVIKQIDRVWGELYGYITQNGDEVEAFYVVLDKGGYYLYNQALPAIKHFRYGSPEDYIIRVEKEGDEKAFKEVVEYTQIP